MSKKPREDPKHVKLAFEVIERYRLIRALHTCYYNLLDKDVQDFASEFFFLVGDVIEGKQLDDSAPRHIDLNRVYEFVREER